MRQRIITGIIGGAFFLLFVWLGDIWYASLVSLLAIVGYFEYFRMMGLKWYRPHVLLGYLLLFYLLSLGFYGWTIAFTIPIFWFAAFLFLLLTVFSKNRISVVEVAFLLIGAIYIGLGFHFMINTRLMENGLEWTSIIIACIWASDSGAYFSGRFFGKHKLWPSISPKKTIEGAIGGIVLSIGAAFLFYYFGHVLESLWVSLLVGTLISVLGHLGDLIESALKRFLDVKDSGDILPGHGGVLDRFDSMLPVFPILYMMIHF